MAVQHDAIVDAERHEAKHADAASNGQVLKANGDTTTSFVTPSTLNNIVRTTVLENSDTTTQTPAAKDTPLQVVFGAATSNADITLAAGGTVTFNTAAVYDIDIKLQVNRTAAAGNALVVARLLVNDVAVAPVYYVALADLAGNFPLQIKLTRAFAATNTLKVQIMQDNAGLAQGTLTSFNPNLAGWDNVPSAYIKIVKVAGAA
jgi:hypothetical protein